MSHTPSPGDRLHGLDAVRAIALLLGVVLHASLSYFPTPIWPVPDAETSSGTYVVMFAIHLFRMTAFFVVAGLFAQMLMARRGMWGFAKNRLGRIANPLFGMWWVVFPAVIAVIVWKAALDNGGTIPTDGPPPPPLVLETLPLLHLWFLWVLLVFYAAVLILRPLARLIDREGRIADRLAGWMVGPWTPLIPTLPLAAALAYYPNWIPFFGIPTPDYGFVPNVPALVGFGLAFAMGWLLARRLDLLPRLARLWPLFLIVGGATGTAAFLLAGGLTPAIEVQLDIPMRLTQSWVTALAVYSSAFAFIGLCVVLFSRANAVVRYLSDASYWTYLIHLPLVMVAQVLVLDLAMPWGAKMAIVMVSVTAVCLITYELLVRHTFVGKALNGRRVPWRKPGAAALRPAE
ncbi:MAG: acyltransferase family protein [Alphaproteobacteria bacterium]|nr:acyltransferase family protein [Alphaproteobacteria bacterium]MBU1527332.1 acyltransferase family protein [Alphaproteobacteria bacterium]MBU2118183.1 acyltransferase family protein [Alphaproteobacteria bacterium]MBU2352332.1 acyltransferase family protein [Alphaproteobacteria bacterium]MBU2382933.1 acyltransferase family protein [Alphaproteobacteria bacterium]